MCTLYTMYMLVQTVFDSMALNLCHYFCSVTRLPCSNNIDLNANNVCEGVRARLRETEADGQ